MDIQARSSDFTYIFRSVRDIVFGPNVTEQVGELARTLTSGKNTIIITDPGVLKAGLVEKVRDSLKKHGFNIEVYSKAVPEPTLDSVDDATKAAREAKVDVIIGLGGGSSMDTAKVAGRAFHHPPGSLKKYMREPWIKPGIPVITIATTAGTGAEFTKAAVASLPEEKAKAWFVDVRAAIAIVDPLIMMGLPSKLTATTGLDALSHAIEPLLSIKRYPLPEALSFESIRLISRYLEKATYQGNDYNARYGMALASLMAGMSETNGGSVEGHAIAHDLGGYYHGLHHGLVCGIALPYVMEYNLPLSKDMLAQVANAMGENVVGLSTHEAAYRGIYACTRLLKSLKLPISLKETGIVSKKDFPDLVERFLTHPWLTPFHANFRRTVTREDVTELFERAWEGKVGET